jgi:hypothetical protein
VLAAVSVVSPLRRVAASLAVLAAAVWRTARAGTARAARVGLAATAAPRPHAPTAVASQSHTRTAAAPALLALAAALAFALTLCLGAGAAAAAGAHGVEKGLWDDTFIGKDATTQEKILTEISDGLGAKTLRLMCFWARCEPKAGVYDAAQLDLLKDAVEAAFARDLKVIVTFYQVPRWASDSKFWADPPGSAFEPDVYYPFYIPRLETMDRWQAFVEHVAGLLEGHVFAYECWNEPNLRWFWYPQQWGGDPNFGVDRYYTLLKRLHDGVRGTDPAALVLAGNTASMGYDDRSSTSPQTWAKRLKELGVLDVMDAYSHHPYALGNTKPMDPPEKAPRFPEITVTLGNIKTLLSIFPDTDFYLTEYGYNSKASRLFAGGAVGESLQADYLRRAFRRANRYSQIKMLMWYLRKDVTGSSDIFDPEMYTGLRQSDDTLKPAWYAYAGGNVVSLVASRRVKRGGRMAVSGVLAHRGVGISGKALVVQRRTAHGWVRVATCKTRAGGRYRVRVRMRHAAVLRVAWRGVVLSRAHSVRVY